MDQLKHQFRLIANELDNLDFETLSQKIADLHALAKSTGRENRGHEPSPIRQPFSPAILDYVASANSISDNLMYMEHYSNVPLLSIGALQEGRYDWMEVIQPEYRTVIQNQLKFNPNSNLIKFNLAFISFRIREYCHGTPLSKQLRDSLGFDTIYRHSVTMFFFIQYPRFIESLQSLNFARIKHIQKYLKDPMNSLFGFNYQDPAYWKRGYRLLPLNIRLWEQNELGYE
jgi:hypothetical protein